MVKSGQMFGHFVMYIRQNGQNVENFHKHEKFYVPFSSRQVSLFAKKSSQVSQKSNTSAECEKCEMSI